MTPDEWRSTVGVHVEQRRTELRLSVRGAAKRAGVSEGLWRQIESGRRVLAAGVERTVSPRPDTAHAIAVALEWEGDGLTRLLAGEQPVVTRPGESGSPELADRVAALERKVSGLIRLAEKSVGVSEVATAILSPADPTDEVGQL